MKYEGIDVNRLKNALSACLNSIHYQMSYTFINEMMDSNVWYCSARENLKGAFVRLTDDYRELKSVLESYMGVANLIYEYQERARQNVNLQNEYNSLNGRLYYEEEYTDRWYNNETEEWEYETKKRTVKDTYIERQMNEASQSINSNEMRMRTLDNAIQNALG